MKTSATFSPCLRYRYTLWREWDAALPYLMVIGLNPSTADETKDDATIRKCIGFAKLWGFGSLCMTNLFAWRDTDPAKMKKALEPVGPENDAWLNESAAKAGMVLAAWGAHGGHLGRDKQVVEVIKSTLAILYCLRVTKDGFPGHPLYIPYSHPVGLFTL